MKKRSKIVCTLGPASHDKETIKAMITAGMNVVRLNFSHGSHDDHATLIQTVRNLAEEMNQPIAIMQDLQGPKIRVGVLPEEGVVFENGQSVSFDTALSAYDGGALPLDFADLHEYVKKGERILLNDGRSEVQIDEVVGTEIKTTVVVGGTITSHKGMNVPDTQLDMPVLTEKDKADLRFGVAQGVDFIALSFVMKPEDVLDLRFEIKEEEKRLGLEAMDPIRIIAKIERREAVDRIEEILDVVDGIMIARGDLGVEIPAQDVPLVQKRLIDLALDYAKPVIVATQMLDSMQHNPRPTRAEVSDVANAVIDHADALMLSNETAVGEFPVETVKQMATIIEETEKSHYDNVSLERTREHSKHKNTHQVETTISRMSRILAEEVHAKLILAASVSGETGRLISRNRPELPIAVATEHDRVQRQLNLSWGIYPFILPKVHSIEELIERAIISLKHAHMVRTGNKIVVVAGEPVGHPGNVNLLEVREIE